MMDVDTIIMTELAEERGFRNGKKALMARIDLWCNTPSNSAAFHPEQKVTQGQVKTANELLKYLKGTE